MQDSIGVYKQLETRFFQTFSEKNYFFEISKCCGYSELVNVAKEGTLQMLYDNVSSIFGKNCKLYIIRESERLWIPSSNDIIKEYLRETPQLKPEYPLPANIVYKIYIDDGSCHINHYQKPIMPPPINICLTCRIHE